MKLRTFALISSAVAITTALAGCSNSMSGMNMNTDRPSASPQAGASFNDPDIAFVTDMIPHHQQAVEMADIVLAKSEVNPQVLALAKTIKAEQGPEIATMTGWLKEWGQPSPAGMEGMAMNGMMSQADMNALKAASGSASSKLFLQQMIQHHQGAIDMANEELTTGKNVGALKLAKGIASSQSAEITTMKTLLKSL